IVLIYFIHHIAVSLQLTNIVAEIVEDTRKAIDNIYPTDLGEPIDEASPLSEEALNALNEREWMEIPAKSSGYIQSIDQEGLAELAEEKRLITRIPVGIGEFVAEGATIAQITASISDAWNSQVDEDLEGEINNRFSVDRHRTIGQDIGFGI